MNKDVIAGAGVGPAEACYALHAQHRTAKQELDPSPAVESF